MYDTYGIHILILRLSTVYVPCINRISTVVDSGEIAEAYLLRNISFVPARVTRSL